MLSCLQQEEERNFFTSFSQNLDGFAKCYAYFFKELPMLCHFVSFGQREPGFQIHTTSSI